MSYKGSKKYWREWNNERFLVIEEAIKCIILEISLEELKKANT